MADNFFRDFDAYVAKVKREIKNVRDAIVDYLQVKTIGTTNSAGDGTPVDTGNLQWNWYVSNLNLGAGGLYTDVIEGVIKHRTTSGTLNSGGLGKHKVKFVNVPSLTFKRNKRETIARNRAALKPIPVQQVVYFQNSAPYVFDIEYGSHSQKAPNGMLRLAILQLQTSIDAVCAAAITGSTLSGISVTVSTAEQASSFQSIQDDLEGSF